MWILLKKTFQKWNDDPVLRFGAALAYYTAFAIVPLLVLVFEGGGLILGEEAAHRHLIRQMTDLLGDKAGTAFQGVLENWHQAPSHWLQTAIAMGALMFAAAGAFNQLQDALNTIWGVQPNPENTFFGRLKQRSLAALGILGTIFLLLVSLMLSALVANLGQILGSQLPGPGVIGKALSLTVSFGLIVLLFAMIFKLLPQAKISWKDVWLGAIITALLFMLGRTVIIYHLSRSAVPLFYGGAGSLVIILLWAYYTSLILLFGAEFTALYASTHGSRIVPQGDATSVGEPARTDERAEQRELGSQRLS